MKPINKQINFFDLDGVLWDIDSRVWVIDKESPSTPIIRLDDDETSKILNGVYLKQEHKIEYNGGEWYLSQELFNRINRKKKISIERLGLSWIEFYDKDKINNSKIKYTLNNIKNLRNDTNMICILTGRAYQNRHAELLNKLRLKLLDLNINIFKIYFVSEDIRTKKQTISLNKAHILLEHMIGLKIEDNIFVPKKQDWYSEVVFYDDEKTNIDYANDIQVLFERVMKKTDDELYLTIMNRLKNNESTLITNLVTNNDINNYVTNIIKLREPIRFPIK